MSSVDPTTGKHMLKQEHGQQHNKQSKKLKTATTGPTSSIESAATVSSLASLAADAFVKLLVKKENSFSVNKTKLDSVRSEVSVAVYKHIFRREAIASEQRENEMRLCIRKLPEGSMATSFDEGFPGVADETDFVYLFLEDMFDLSLKDFQRIKSPSVFCICQVKKDNLKMIPVNNIIHGLKVLHVTHSQLDDDVLKRWESSLAEVDCQAFVQLKIVNLSNSHLGPKGAEIIAKMCPHVTDWNFGWNHIGTSGLQAMVKHNAFAMVIKLDFRGNNIGSEGAEILAKACPTLTHLYLGRNNIGHDGIEAMAKHNTFASITHLDLFETNLGNIGAEAIAMDNMFSNVVDLDLHNNGIMEAGVKALAEHNCFAKLKKLNLSCNNLGDAGVEVLARHNAFPAVEEMNLAQNCIGDDGAKALVKHNAFSMATSLDLSCNEIQDIGKEALVEHQCKNIELKLQYECASWSIGWKKH